MAPCVALAVDRVGIGGAQPGWQVLEGDQCAAVPLGSAPLRFELDRDVAGDELSTARERKGEIVSVRAEFELDVAIVAAEQKQLDDLEVPEPVETTGGRRGRRIAVVGRLDLDFDRLSDG